MFMRASQPKLWGWQTWNSLPTMFGTFPKTSTVDSTWLFCSGILYHLPGADACRFLRSMRQICERITIIDTHVGLRPENSIEWEGRNYFGFVYNEHSPQDSEEVKANRNWSSLDNETSFWFTQSSLLNLLRDVGFTSVVAVLSPKGFDDYADRVTLAAIIGKPQTSNISPELALTPEPDWTEHPTLAPFLAQETITTRPLWRRSITALRHKVGF